LIGVSTGKEERLGRKYEGRSKSFVTQYDAQMTQAKFLYYYST